MDAKTQKKPEKEQPISPLSQESTYGERWHSFIFNNLINFWINLGVSALFTYWVTHSQKPVKFGPIDWPAPSKIQENLAGWFYKRAPMNAFGVEDANFKKHDPLPISDRGKASSYLANVFTLVFAGHFIIVPSVWLGAKLKAPMVKWFNRRHYGDDAMQSDDLQARHAAIEMEERPTFLGAFVGRCFTILATQIAGFTIGNEKNAISKYCGLKFPGIDKIIEIPGAKMGEAAEQLLPKATTRLDAHAVKNQYTWSASQVLHDPSLAQKPYRNVSQHIGKYAAQDIMYTFITSLSISPVINVLKHVIPGLTYTPKVRRIDEASDPIIAEKAATLRVTPNPIAERAEAADAPGTKVLGGKIASPLMAASPPMQQRATV